MGEWEWGRMGDGAPTLPLTHSPFLPFVRLAHSLIAGSSARATPMTGSFLGVLRLDAAFVVSRPRGALAKNDQNIAIPHRGGMRVILVQGTEPSLIVQKLAQSGFSL